VKAGAVAADVATMEVAGVVAVAADIAIARNCNTIKTRTGRAACPVFYFVGRFSAVDGVAGAFMSAAPRLWLACRVRREEIKFDLQIRKRGQSKVCRNSFTTRVSAR